MICSSTDDFVIIVYQQKEKHPVVSIAEHPFFCQELLQSRSRASKVSVGDPIAVVFGRLEAIFFQTRLRMALLIIANIRLFRRLFITFLIFQA